MAVFPVSIKGVVLRAGKVLLAKNERDEWELPGGRIEPGETPEECVAREIFEETQWPVTVGPILDSWMFHITQVDARVFIVTYGCHAQTGADPMLSLEHKEIGLFGEDEIAALPMPDGYKRSIATWYRSG